MGFMLVIAWMAMGRPSQRGAECLFWPGMRSLYPTPLRWKSLAEGFDRIVLKFEGTTLFYDAPHLPIRRKVEMVVFRVDTARYPLRVMTAREVFGARTAKLGKVHVKTGAVLTVNGGYFSRSGAPMGLVVSRGKVLSRWSKEGGSGALALFHSSLRIEWARHVNAADPPPLEAIQNGPLLIEPEHKFGMTHRRDRYFPRTVVALDREGRLLVAVTRKFYGNQNIHCGLNLMETAVLFYNSPEIGGLGAVVAMNLDGGTSTGMRLTLGKYRDRVPVNIEMPPFICVMPCRGCGNRRRLHRSPS